MFSRTCTLMAACLLFCVTVQPFAEGAGAVVERIVKKDGSTITGEVIDFEDGRYSVRVGDSVVLVPARDVRTIDEQTLTPAKPVESSRFEDLITVQEVLDSLGRRTESSASQESVRAFQDAVAAVLRGEWDFCLRLLGRLLDSEPRWADPQILHGAVLMEQGDTVGSVRTALRLEGLFTDDVLALRTAAEIYRRVGFVDRYAATLESVIRSASGEERVDYELAHLWWPLDARRGAEHWERYRQSDPELRSPWCREGDHLRRAQLALEVEDWYAAQSLVDDLVRRYPWMAPDTRDVRIRILEARLRSSEISGHLEVALLSTRALLEMDEARTTHWNERLSDLQSVLLQQGLRQEDVPEFRQWCNRHAHLLGGSAAERDRCLSEHYQTLALDAIESGDLEQARIGFVEATRRDDEARPEELDAQLERCVQNVRHSLLLGRRERALSASRLLVRSYPERGDALGAELRDMFREALEPRLTATDLASAMDELQSALTPPSKATVELPTDAAAPASFLTGEMDVVDQDPSVRENRVEELAQPAIARYFPHAVGTQWVYKRGDGRLETRRVTEVKRMPHGALRIEFQVSEDGQFSESFETYAFLVGPDVLIRADAVPPGEYGLRYPFSDGATWNWAKGPFRFVRRIVRPTEPLHLPIGSHRDYFVVEAKNSFVPDTGDEEHSVTTRLTYVAGIGLARIEASDDSLSRVLVEFLAPEE